MHEERRNLDSRDVDGRDLDGRNLDSHPGTWTAGVWSTATTTWMPNAPQHAGTAASWIVAIRPSPDTTYNFDTNASPPDAVTPRWSSLYPAEQYSSCPQAVMGLSYDWTSMTTLVNNMSPNGSTNQAIGLQLGWLSLVGGGPFTMPPLKPATITRRSSSC